MDNQPLSGSGLNNTSGSSSANSENNEQFNLTPRTWHANAGFVADDHLSPTVNGRDGNGSAETPRSNGWPRPNSSDNFGTILGFLESGNGNDQQSFPFNFQAGSAQLLLLNVSRLDQRNFYTDVRAELDEKRVLSQLVVQFKVTCSSYRDILRSLADEVSVSLPLSRPARDSRLLSVPLLNSDVGKGRNSRFVCRN
jgi:hypothetical protein